MPYVIGGLPMSLPSDPVLRRKVDKAIEEVVSSKIRQDGEKELQSEIATQVQDSTDMPKAEFNKRAILRYKERTNLEKYNEDSEWYENVFEENDILKGNSK
jgi:hypothetical protein